MSIKNKALTGSKAIVAATVKAPSFKVEVKNSKPVETKKTVAVEAESPDTVHVWSNLNGPLLFARGEAVIVRDDTDFPQMKVMYGYERKGSVNVYELEIMDGTGRTYGAFEDSMRLETSADVAKRREWEIRVATRLAAKLSREAAKEGSLPKGVKKVSPKAEKAAPKKVASKSPTKVKLARKAETAPVKAATKKATKKGKAA
jgi:hypothetical protein